jgi:SAM-dependent methyltransferase
MVDALAQRLSQIAHAGTERGRVSTNRSVASPAEQAEVNASLWTRGHMRIYYRRQRLRAAEQGILDRYSSALSGRVLELGCGGGRITRRLVTRADQVTGIDISAAMVAECRRLFPGARFLQGDLRDLSGVGPGPWDVVVAGFNVLDVLDADDRARVLDALHGLIRPGGLLIMSSHNLACAPLIPEPTRNLSANPVRLANRLARLPRAIRNRRRLKALQRFTPDYAILNDVAHDYALLHYYVSRDGQERQFAAHGFALLECTDMTGALVAPGESAYGCHELHYVAERTA